MIFLLMKLMLRYLLLVDRLIAVICLQLSLSYNRSIDINDYLHNKKTNNPSN